MKINCILTSCNLNKKYTDFIPLFIKSWNKFYPNIDVKIVLICNKIPDYLNEWRPYIIQFNEIDNMYSSFISQYIRILYPALLNYDKGVMITDIDMLPMNNTYYTNCVKNFKNSHFITFRNGRIDKKQLIICYNCARPKTWSDIFKINNINDVIDHLKNVYKNIKYEDGRLKSGWYSDQINLYKYLNNWDKKSIRHKILDDKNTNFNRLCRKTNFTLTKEIKNNIKKGYYSEYHAYSPYEEYEKINNDILNLILNN